MPDPNAFGVVKDFELALCDYTGAPYAVTTTSCTAALLLATRYCIENAWWPPPEQPPNRPAISIPKFTYVSVPMSIIHAGGYPSFRDEDWLGTYQLKPLPVWDSARRFTAGMYRVGQMQCCSFHVSKILGDTQGGAILHDDPVADVWLRKARFDGRTIGVAPKDDNFDMVGWHAYLSPDVAARLLWKLSVLPRTNQDLKNDDYPDLSLMEVFK